MIKNIIAGIKSYLKRRKVFFIILFLLLLSSIVWGPLGVPIKCHTGDMDVSVACPGTPPPPGSVMAVDCPLVFHETRECFSLIHKEFWQHPEWPVGLEPLKTHFNFQSTPPPIKTTHIDPIYPADFSNNQILMGASHNVFIGKVLAQVGTNDFMGDPATQFSVQIIDNIKGDLNNTVVVNQSGGYKDGVLYVMDEGGALLQPGATYLLATRYDTDAHYYTLNPHENASKLVSTDNALSIAALRTLIAKDPKVRALQVAYPNEELLQADVYHANIRNNFKSLSADMKATAQSRADAAKASLAASANAQ